MCQLFSADWYSICMQYDQNVLFSVQMCIVLLVLSQQINSNLGLRLSLFQLCSNLSYIALANEQRGTEEFYLARKSLVQSFPTKLAVWELSFHVSSGLGQQAVTPSPCRTPATPSS